MFFVTRTRSGEQATESFWMNYPEPEKLYDYRFLGDTFRGGLSHLLLNLNWVHFRKEA